MAIMQKPSRELWTWLFREGGRYTVNEIAAQFEWSLEYTFQQVYSMRRSGLLQEFDPAPGSARKRWGITGLCTIPQGMKLAEVQA